MGLLKVLRSYAPWKLRLHWLFTRGKLHFSGQNSMWRNACYFCFIVSNIYICNFYSHHSLEGSYFSYFSAGRSWDWPSGGKEWNADSSLRTLTTLLFFCPIVMLTFWGTSVFICYYYAGLSKRRKYWKKVGWGSEIRTWKCKIFKGKPDTLPGPLVTDPFETLVKAMNLPRKSHIHLILCTI